MARPRNIDESEKVDRQIVNLEVDMYYLKPTSFLVLPETPNIYLTNEKARKFIKELKDAVDFSKDGIIIRLQGEINPRQDDSERDGSMFLSREVTVEDAVQDGGQPEKKP
ncbi:MAG TPA: hypothetical protein P5511_07405 [Candidatus Goldiibacteriota bacterium]|nr:hypothetical protein [Candidatus Goldiibacteriota bacterium]